MTTRKKSVKKASTRKQASRNIFERFDESFVAVPFKVANKTFLAGLGLMVVTGKEFGKRFDKYAKDGETVRRQIRKSFDEIRKDLIVVKKDVKEVGNDVREGFKKAA
jgi:hypothetical protein